MVRISVLRRVLGSAALCLLRKAYKRLLVGPVASLFVDVVFILFLGRTHPAPSEQAGGTRPRKATYSDPLGIAAALLAALIAACAFTALCAIRSAAPVTWHLPSPSMSPSASLG